MNTFGAGARPALCVNECGEYCWSNFEAESSRTQTSGTVECWMLQICLCVCAKLSTVCSKCVRGARVHRAGVTWSDVTRVIFGDHGDHDHWPCNWVSNRYSPQFGDKSNCNFLRPQNYAVQYLILILEQQEVLASVTRNSNDDLY